jgi:Fe-S cluster assembly scaffold protein SufB
MTQVFLKPGFQKVTKMQLQLDAVKFKGALASMQIDSVNSEFTEQVAKLNVEPFELFSYNLNPLTEFVKQNVTNFKLVHITESSDDPVVIEVKKLVHTIVVVDENIQAKIVFDGEDSCFASAEIYLKNNADLKVILLQLNCDEFNFSCFRTKLEAGARIEWFLNFFAITNAYSFVQNWLVGEQAQSDIHLVSASKLNEVSDFFVGNCFDAKNCKGEIWAKGVSQGKSKMSFVGEIEITLQGGGTDSYLKEDVLMLDATSKIDAVPSLEIKTNDVKAGHGVSISRLTEDKLFYLTSRGISTEEAQKLVLAGFLRDGFSKIEMPEIVAKLDSLIE